MGTLADDYVGIVFDLDGVCFRGATAIPAAPPALAELRRRGVGVAFVTNNSTRTATDVASHLAALGMHADPSEVVTSSHAAAASLAPGTRCVVIGMGGLRGPLTERGCIEVEDPDEADAVVVGLDLRLTFDSLHRATQALASGARFLGTNADVSVPLAEGISPGAGSLLAALAAATGRQPDIAGKPQAALFETAAERLPDGPLLMVGDRVDTDIVGGQRVGWDTALVLSGVTSADEAARVRPAPTYVLDDIGGLLEAPPTPAATAERPTREGSDAHGISVRAATPADDEAITALWDEAGMLAYTPEPSGDLDSARAAAADLVVVAEREGRVVGVLLGTCDGRRGLLQRLAVDRAERGRGVGRQLVEHVERRLVDRGISRASLLVFPDNHEALAFWKALGYSTRTVEMGIKRLDDPD